MGQQNNYKTLIGVHSTMHLIPQLSLATITYVYILLYMQL